MSIGIHPARQSVSHFNVLHVSIDGVQAAGRHNEIMIAADPMTQEAAIPPPKVAKSISQASILIGHVIYF